MTDRPLSAEELSMQVGECSCSHCQKACTMRPGFFRADQIEPLAQAMGLTVDELFRGHLQVDYWQGGDLPDTFLLVPRHVGQDGGSQVPFDPRGTCHWFENGKCAIHTLGKPAECQGLGHVDGATVTADREAIVATWKDKQDFISDLQGEPLEPPDLDFGAAMDMMMGSLGLGSFRDE